VLTTLRLADAVLALALVPAVWVAAGLAVDRVPRARSPLAMRRSALAGARLVRLGIILVLLRAVLAALLLTVDPAYGGWALAAAVLAPIATGLAVGAVALPRLLRVVRARPAWVTTVDPPLRRAAAHPAGVGAVQGGAVVAVGAALGVAVAAGYPAAGFAVGGLLGVLVSVIAAVAVARHRRRWRRLAAGDAWPGPILAPAQRPRAA